MCDRIEQYETAIRFTESDVKRLTDLLERCKESTKKKYKCYLIKEQLDNKKQALELMKGELQENIKLCNNTQEK
jgi:hypothetical protein